MVVAIIPGEKSSIFLGKKYFNVETMVVMGKGLAMPSSVTLNGVMLSTSHVNFDNNKGVLQFVDLTLPLNAAIDLQWK